MRVLVKEPFPVPSDVLESAMVGLEVVLQHTPLAEVISLPALVILPPLRAEVEDIEDTGVVIIVINSPRVVMTY